MLTGLPGIPGAIIVAFDEEGTPLTSGACHLEFTHEKSQLEALFELHQQLAPQMHAMAWTSVVPSLVRQEKGQAGEHWLWALPVHSSSKVLGLVLVAVSDDTGSRTSLQSIAQSGDILAAGIQSSLRTEAWTRIEKLQQLAWTTFAQAKWDLEGLVGHLARLFEADAVTMLLKEQEELRLAASTDPKLGSDKPVLYKPGQGLTGYVFETGNPLRLSDTGDREEILRVTGKDRKKAMHPERDADGLFTGQFLGVAMRFGGKVVGVLRMSRRRGIARFTREDEKALQFFADLLGAAFSPAWDLLLEKSVLESVTELIAVSRREIREEGSASVSRIIMANPGAEKLLGRSRKEIEGIEVRELYDPEEFEEIRQQLKPALAEARQKGHGAFGPVSTRLRRSDGSLVPVVISYRFLSNQLVSPPTSYTIGLARDISDSEQQAAQHRRLLELLGTMRIAYFSVDQNGFTQVTTPIDSELTGYPEDELRTMPRDRLFYDDRERDQFLKKAREHGGQLAGGLVRIRRKDGTFFWAEGDLRILSSQEGEIGREGLYRDVTDRIRLQGFLNADTERILSDHELFKRLKQDAEFHLDYMSSLGHQLQTPLGSLVETLRNFESGVLSQRELGSRLPYVIGQAIVCTRLVRNLSYMDKILRGESFQRERVSLTRLAIETKLDFIHLLKEKQLELRVDDESLNRFLRVNGHREMLRQVVVNLVDNAIKYSFPGTTIEIRGRQWPEGPAFEVSNQGLPIPETDRENIFQRGFRTSKAQALVPHGTGLGLWLVRKIVDAHGASIRCQEALESGQKRILFRVTFPEKPSGARRAP